MNLKTTYILFGVLLAVLLLFAATQFSGCQSGPDKEGYLFADFHAKKDPVKTEDIDTVRIERAGSPTLVFTREKGAWQMTEPYPLRTDTYQVGRVVDEVTGVRPEKSQMTGKLGQYGLTEPRVVVTLKKGDKEWKLNVGDESEASTVAYVSTSVRPKEPFAVARASLGAVLDSKLNEFRDKGLLTATLGNTSGVKLTEAKGTTLALEKSGEGRWHFQEPAFGAANFEGESPATPPGVPPPATDKKVSGVRELVEDAAGLRVEANDDFVAQGVSEADLASKYGLGKDRPETLRIEAKVKPASGDEKTEVLLVGKKAPKVEEKKDDKKAEKKPEDRPEYYYVRLEGENSVERVPAAKVKPLLDAVANPDPLRSRDLVALSGAARIDAVNVQFGNSDVKLRQADHKWTLYHGGPRPTDEAAVAELIEALTGENAVSHKKQPPVKTFVDKDEGLEFDKPAAVVSVWIDGVKKPEKKDDKKDAENKDDDKKDEKKDDQKDKEPELKSDRPSVTLTFGKRDRDKGIVYVRRDADGDKTVVTVSDTLLDRVTSSYLTYLDRKLPTFTEGPMAFDVAKDVTKLALRSGDKTWEVTKEKSGDKTTWKFTQPEAMAGRNANELGVGDILHSLSSLRAEKIVDEKPSESNLDQIYGLKNPETKVTVTVQKGDKTEDWVYSFGKQDEKKNGVFARMNKTDLVFLVRKQTVDQLTAAELRDLTVFSYDPSKVKGLKISGWTGLGLGVQTLDLERKAAKDWTAKAPPAFPPNGDVVENFVGSLASLHAVKFVTPKGDTGLDVNNGALKVEITVEGQEAPLEITVGKEDPETKGLLFATSNRLKGDVFLVPQNLFKEAMVSPAYFRKK